MYHFHQDLNLDHILNCEIIQISLSEYNLYINLEPKNIIHFMSSWRILDEKNDVVDEGNMQTPKEEYRIYKLLGKKINGYKIENETTLVFILENNWKIIMIDDSEQYESGFISPNIYI